MIEYFIGLVVFIIIILYPFIFWGVVNFVLEKFNKPFYMPYESEAFFGPYLYTIAFAALLFLPYVIGLELFH